MPVLEVADVLSVPVPVAVRVPPVLPEPVESPGAYETLATVPAMGARSVAPARAACASASRLRALARCAFAEASASLARGAVDLVLRGCDARGGERHSILEVGVVDGGDHRPVLVTVSPTSTSTEVTVPDEVNEAVELLAGSIVPEADTVWLDRAE